MKRRSAIDRIRPILTIWLAVLIGAAMLFAGLPQGFVRGVCPEGSCVVVAEPDASLAFSQDQHLGESRCCGSERVVTQGEREDAPQPVDEEPCRCPGGCGCPGCGPCAMKLVVGVVGVEGTEPVVGIWTPAVVNRERAVVGVRGSIFHPPKGCVA